MKWIILSATLLVFLAKADEVAVEERQSGEGLEFIPTHEWQEILPGQAIPPGLHVKMSMTTGKKMAKLLDEEDAKNDHNLAPGAPATATGQVQIVVNDGGGIDSVTEEVPLEPQEVVEGIDGETQALPQAGEASTNQRSYHDERSEKYWRDMLKNMNENMAHNRDPDVIMEELQIHLDPVQFSVERRLHSLEVLEELSHQFDNGLVIMGNKGLDILLRYVEAAQDLDISSGDEAWEDAMQLAAAASRVVGSACSNNPEVQKAAVEAGWLESLLRFEEGAKCASVPSRQLTTLEFQNRALFALSNILRHNKQAQLNFAESNGLAPLRFVLLSLMSESVDDTTKSLGEQKRLLRTQHKVARKSIGLVRTLVVDCLVNNITQVVEDLTSNEWCELYTRAMPSPSNTAKGSLLVIDELIQLFQELTSSSSSSSSPSSSSSYCTKAIGDASERFTKISNQLRNMDPDPTSFQHELAGKLEAVQKAIQSTP